MSDPLSQRGRLGAINEALRYEGPRISDIFEGLVQGIDRALRPTQTGQGLPLGRGGGMGPPAEEVFTNAYNILHRDGELSAMQYLGQYSPDMSEDQMRQILNAISVAQVQGTPQGGASSLPVRVQSLADRVGIRQNEANPMNRLNDLIAHLPDAASRERALAMYNDSGRQVTPELVNYLEMKWGL